MKRKLKNIGEQSIIGKTNNVDINVRNATGGYLTELGRAYSNICVEWGELLGTP